MMADGTLSIARPVLALSGALLLVVPSIAWAQHTESNDEPIGHADGTDKPLVRESPRYVIPDLPVKSPRDPDKPEPFFTIRPSLSLILDFTGFDQDATNVAQIGRQEDSVDVRSSRLSLIGTIGRDYRATFQISGEYKGFDSDPETSWQLTDLSLTLPVGERTRVTLGKTKETFSYEMVGDSANLPHSERVLNAFFVSRNLGARIVHVLGRDKRATLSAGAYKDSWTPGSSTDRDWDFSARATALVWDDPARNRFLHLGLAYRHAGVENDVTRYKVRAETNVGDNSLDTGNFSATSADHFGAEGLLNIGSASLLGEYVTAQVHRPGARDPKFQGWYLTGSWILTGETRPYDRNVAYARRVIPKGRWGAPELAARFSHVDLDDEGIDGGSFDKTMLGLNWWATTRWKFGVSWGHTWLKRSPLVGGADVKGESDVFLTRLQWIY